ncbi:MAG: hypothetical protein CSA97_02840 [Bacteroidetes bacterium]|nr:MAG: hypothetical protein CSA97_02840 [Bacteroidota bacterium]
MIMRKITIVLSIVLLSSLGAKAQNAKLQSAFIYQFTKLIEWCPAGKSGDFKIGVLGSGSAVGKELDRLHGRNVGSQTIKIVSFPSPGSVAKCNILYVPSSYASKLGSLKSKLSGGCALVVCDKVGSYGRGADISFDASGGRLSFEVNKTSMKGKGMKVSNKLVNLAKRSM